MYPRTGRLTAPSLLVSTLATCVFLCQAPAATPGKAIRANEFTGLHALIKPQPGESKWAQIPWLTNLSEARQRSAKEDKPLLLWRSGGGDVLGRT